MMPGSPAPAHTAQLGARVRYQHLEVTSSKEWATALTDVEDAHGPVSVMVNNAGILDLGPHRGAGAPGFPPRHRHQPVRQVARKWGLRGLTKTAALELAADRIRVCFIHPGPISTPMTASLDDVMIAAQPIARWGTPDEAARMALFVAADATYSTGSEFEVDGGATTGSMILTQTDTETGTAD